ncbi:hypothetical protein A2870_02540 [Candidatus Curtissbacteria bacterium RIFCSPHIGHO2_01_FULL_41_11]|uniref:Isopentenyl phosphate kinase n=1 Tax=Candidatus Curtissbacteria bacterium RIFCSPHIGHO2_01_FULL_41_11 TaxID=1797711 RepID=A0A1F5G8N3_9BACT|nr:MAG: hypothetical protein A2870_02540 [Candidatus Curtissbacteria bacterium RIFCSPHIGHO2_01_FULL_41_11]
MKNLILIKFGGSAITEKNKRKTPNYKVINQLAREIAEARKKTKDLLLIGHGQGSFAHVPAKKFKTKEGNINLKSAIGIAQVRLECIELNAIILDALIKNQVPAVTFEPHAFLTTNYQLPTTHYLDPIIIALQNNLVPVIYGDTIMDKKIGWTIYSGEQILNILALNLSGFKPKLIIEVGQTEGVLDTNSKTIPKITPGNFKSIEKMLSETTTADVTGGMKHKVQEALTLAQKGIPTLLISSKPGNPKNAILGKKTQGTWIIK